MTSKTIPYGDREVPIFERPWQAATPSPYKMTYKLKPGEHWAEAPVTHNQFENYVLLDDGQAIPVGAAIARELMSEGAKSAVFTELWHGLVLVGPDLICVSKDHEDFKELLANLKAANGGRFRGLPDVIACFPDSRIAMREAKNLAAKDRLNTPQHEFARAAYRLLGARLDLGVIQWGRIVAQDASPTELFDKVVGEI
jgi:hypothetical protein